MWIILGLVAGLVAWYAHYLTLKAAVRNGVVEAQAVLDRQAHTRQHAVPAPERQAPSSFPANRLEPYPAGRPVGCGASATHEPHRYLTIKGNRDCPGYPAAVAG